MLTRCLSSSKWQWPSTTHAWVGLLGGPCTKLAPETCERCSAGNSAIILIAVLQWSTVDKSHGEEVATDSTVPPQCLTNWLQRTSLTMDWAGSRSASHPRSCTSSPNFSHGTPKCSAKTSKTTVMERNLVDSWCGPNFPRSSCASQCFPCRCTWLLVADWQCQQAFSGTQNHGKWMECTCLRKHLRGSRHTVHCANSLSLSAGSSAGSTDRGSSDIIGDIFSGTTTMTVLTSVGIFGASFSCPSRLTVINSSTLPLSAAPPAELLGRTCDQSCLHYTLRGINYTFEGWITHYTSRVVDYTFRYTQNTHFIFIEFSILVSKLVTKQTMVTNF